MTITFSEKQKKIIKLPFDVTLDVQEGTPRSGKTTACHFRYARYLINSRDENHLIVAYNQEQAFRLFIDGDGTGLKHIFGEYARMSHDDNGDHLVISTPNGEKKVFYKGAGKADSAKAITGMSLGSVVFCEINLLHMGMIQECFRRTFAAKDRYHMADLNPPAPNHPVIAEVFDVQNTRWNHWTIQDNPIITEERKQEIYETLSKNPYLLQRDWYGKRVIPAGVIYSMFNLEKNQIPELTGKKIEMYFSGDGGQSDATSMSCNIVTRHKGKKRAYDFKLNRVAHYYHSGADTGETKAMSVYAKELKQFILWCEQTYGMRRTEVFIDPACKSLREELHMVGIQTRPANNNAHDIKGSSKGIEVGIERLQSAMTNEQFVLVEQPNDQYDHYNFMKELGMYARDKNGKPIDDFNHSLDECRYSNNYFYKRYVL